ncbi:MAG TPA: cupin domain-containing protein [Longimicrobiales bacterium]|nr:cupin domain-containing protein [Longimicrobiales bacterium]
MRVLSSGPGQRDERPATEILHDEASVRVVMFHLKPGQQVRPHTSPSSVLVTVLSGHGEFTGADDATELNAGDSAVYEPGEVHGMVAGTEPLRFLAIITPRPGG